MIRLRDWSLHREGLYIRIWGEREDGGVATLTSPVISLSDAGVAETFTGSIYQLSEVGDEGLSVVAAKNLLGNESFL